jgi:hypothetical protein
MRDHGLSFVQSVAGFNICRDPCGMESVAADTNMRTEIGGAALDHAPGIDAVHLPFGQDASTSSSGSEEGKTPRLFILDNVFYQD